MLHLGVVAIEKKFSGRPRLRSLTLLYICVYMYIYIYIYIYIYKQDLALSNLQRLICY